jgi:hypothetical protein
MLPRCQNRSVSPLPDSPQRSRAGQGAVVEPILATQEKFGDGDPATTLAAINVTADGQLTECEERIWPMKPKAT